MFKVTTALTDLLRSRSRDLIYVYEIYHWHYVPFPEGSALSYDPRFALRRFAGKNISFSTGTGDVAYERQVLEGPSLKKTKGKQFDSVAVKFSNASRDMASFVLNNRIQGMRLVVRSIPRSAPLTESPGDPGAFIDSTIEFVGRIEKPDNFTRESGTISAKQDLGTIEAQIPERDYQPTCPLRFKKGDCLGDQTLAEKTPTYQAAKICNKTEEQCIEYGNEKYFQGTKLIQIESSFVHKAHRGIFGKILAYGGLGLVGALLSKRKKTTVGNSILDNTPYGQPVSVILGRWQMQLTTLQCQDLGNTINMKEAACRGPIKDFLNIRNDAPNFSQPGSIIKHLGEYGGVGTQTQDLLFPGGEYHSKLAYFTASCVGSDILVEDPAPDNSSLIAGQIVRVSYGLSAGVALGTGRIDNVLAGYDSGEDGWTDNPVDLAVHIISDPAYLGLPLAHIGQHETSRTSAYTTGAIKDLSNAERCLFPNTETLRAGVDYKRYYSTGLIGALSFFGTGLGFLFQAQKPGGYWAREALYEFFDPDAPPDSLDVITRYRKRYTCNLAINEKQKAIDLLYDKLLTSFRGFIRWDHHGRLVVDCERPAEHSFLRSDVASAATSIKVLDVTRWKPLDSLEGDPNPLRGKVLIGAHKLTSEVRPVTSSSYSAEGNGIPYSASSTGTMSATAAGASLSGGSSTTPASGSVEIAGSCAVGDQISITIDGYEITITATQEDVDASIDNLTIACQLVYAINAEPRLNEYIEAWRTGSNPTTVEIYCKYGALNFSTPLEGDHFAEIAEPEDAPAAATSAGSLVEGVYLLSYAYRNANGNTNISPILAIDVADNEQIDIDAITLPTAADSVDWFISVEANSDVRLLVLNNDGSAFSIDELPVVTAAQEPKRNTTGEEILRVMMSFAGKALTYADTTRANILDGSVSWPEGGRQSTINQAKGTIRHAIEDFAERQLIVNDERHQEDTGEINPVTLDLSAVDNHNQGVRLLNGYLAKYRDLDFFFKHASAGEALLLEIGDLICISDDSGAWRNTPVTIEDLTKNSKFEVSFTNRLYSMSAFDDAVLQTQVPLPSALVNYLAAPPDIEFNTTDFPPDGLELGNDGVGGVSSIRGGAVFGATIYPGQWAKVRLIIRAGLATSEVVVSRIEPDSNLEAIFEFLASAPGLYRVELEAFSGLNVPNPNKPYADIVVGLGAVQGDWVTPLVQLSGAGSVEWTGAGTYTIPMITESGAGEPQPAGGGNFDIP